MEIAIIGASGYTGGELMRLLLHHSSADVVAATSRKLDGTPVASVHPHLRGLTDHVFRNTEAGDIHADFVFLAVPHTAAMKVAGTLMERGIKTVDLSADYRLAKDVFEKTYGVPHDAYFEAPYGLTELHREEVRGASFVANPGCIPTGATLDACARAMREAGAAQLAVLTLAHA